ncbi:MAG: hypothetical protein O9327_02085 [Polaromonas sp.]|nr:hypothetical protein [Polaromonas sp.]
MPQALRKVTSGRVAQPNTPDTDRQPEVLHIVTGETLDGKPWKKLVMAADPLTANDLLRDLPEDAFNRLQDADDQE